MTTVKSLLFIVLLMLTACDNTTHLNEPMAVHPLPHLTSTFPYTSGGEEITHKSEVYVISNASDDPDKLIDFVKAFNQMNPPDEDLKKFERYDRRFYRESKAMPRDYQEGPGGYFELGDDSLDDHGEDMILIVYWWDHGAEVEYRLLLHDF